MIRPTIQEYFMSMADLVATRSTCLRRSVGCVLVSVRGHVLSTGYNGVARGQPHCNEVSTEVMSHYHEPEKQQRMGLSNMRKVQDVYYYDMHPYACSGASAESGKDLDQCEAIHAEQNALLQCRDAYEIAYCYTTTFPCLTCVKLLLNTACNQIIYREPYDQRAEQLWASASGRYAILLKK